MDKNIFFNFLVKISFQVGLVQSGLKLIFHWNPHSLTFAELLLSSKELILTSQTAEKRDTPSANSLQFHNKSSNKSHM